MEVSKVSTAVSHVIIGGQDSIQMGITDNAEFFQMLSSALYRNPKLAMIRETMCNCWDAHVMNNANRPIEITLTNEKIVFRDYGPGIHHDSIGPIYGVYGNSTKRNQNNQTGGFGLGCKSPFAYQNHFQVISFHEGTKTIYRMAKSNGEVKGKPSITPIVSLPTEETGLEVTIDVMNMSDRVVFSQYIKQVANNAGIPVLLNDVLMTECIDYSNAVNKYVLTACASGYGPGERVLIKVGDVVYPIADESTYSAEFWKADKFLKRIDQDIRLILIADPGTISITPSREAITAETNDVVRDLLRNFLKDTEAKVLNFYPEFLKEYRKAIVQRSLQYAHIRERALSTVDRFVITPTELFSMYGKPLLNTRDIAKRIFCDERAYPIGFKTDLTKRIAELAKTVPDHMRNTVPRYIEHLKRVKGICDESKINAFHRIFLPHFLKACPGIPLKSVHVRLIKRTDKENRWYCDPDLVVPVTDVPAQTIYTTSPLLNGYVVLYRGERNLVSRIRNQWSKVLKHDPKYQLLDPESYFCVKAPTKTKDLEEYRRILNESGYLVIDAVSKFDWEKPTVTDENGNTVVAVPKKAASKRTGLPVASNLLNSTGMGINTHRTKYGEPSTIEGKPEFYIQVSYRGNDGEYSLSGLNCDDSTSFIKLYGSRGVVISTVSQREKLIKDGVPDHIEFISREMNNEIKADWKLRRMFAYSLNGTLEKNFRYRDAGYNEFEALKSSRTAKKLLGIKDETSDPKRKFFKGLIEANVAEYQGYPNLTNKNRKLINRIKENPARHVSGMVEIARKSELLQVIKIGQLDQLIANGNKFAGEILKNALKG